jgi:hypothetical protein
MGYRGGNGVLYGYTLGIPLPVRTCGIYSSAHGGAGGRACALVFVRSAFAGITWTSRTTGAPRACREGHTSVIDARTRAIYVIGGSSSSGYYKDVGESTDGGVRPDSVQGGNVGGTTGVLRGYSGVLHGYYRGTKW